MFLSPRALPDAHVSRPTQDDKRPPDPAARPPGASATDPPAAPAPLNPVAALTQPTPTPAPTPPASSGPRRREFNAGQVEELHDRLERRLNNVGLETQPEVAGRILSLVQQPDAQIKDYAEAIRSDWTIAGRILRMANSAFYAQRTPVTKLERALIVLGTERTKAIALGFYLSRMASTTPARQVSRRVWSQSVYRATLCHQLARAACPHLASEAFVVGLMLDCGQPLIAQLEGSRYLELIEEANSPGKLFALEYDRLEFTHVDVFAVLARKWKLPRLLARPVVWHHTLPPVGRSSDPTVLLHRLAYYVGAIQLADDAMPKHDAPLSTIADRLFEIPSDDLGAICRVAAREYKSTMTAFEHIADEIPDIEALADSVRMQLMELLDEQFGRSLRLETRGGVEKFNLGEQIVEVEPGRSGEVAAYITTGAGQRLLSCTVNPNKESPEVIARLLGLEETPPEELAELIRVMRVMAA